MIDLPMHLSTYKDRVENERKIFEIPALLSTKRGNFLYPIFVHSLSNFLFLIIAANFLIELFY